MSHTTYNNLWKSAQERLRHLLAEEQRLQALPLVVSRRAFFQQLSTFFVQYVRIYRQLEEAHDQVIHAQKSQLIRIMLEGVMGRLLELKTAMVEADACDFHYMDDILQDMKLTPADVELSVPRHFLAERASEMRERESRLRTELGLEGWVSAEGATEEGAAAIDSQEGAQRPTLNRNTAVRILQVAERARQGRARADFVRKVKRDEAMQSRRGRSRVVEESTRESSALSIQRMWRGYLQRKRTRTEREEELVLLGMATPGHRDASSLPPSAAIIEAAANEARRRQRRQLNEAEYQAAIGTSTQEIKEEELRHMKEEAKDQIHQWIAECRDATGALPDFPKEEEGGSALIFVEDIPERRREEQDGEPEPKVEPEAANDDPEEIGLKLPPSKFLPSLEAAQKTYAAVWQNRERPESPTQRHDTELIKEGKRKEVEEEARWQVDELLREELTNLKKAMGVDEGVSKAKGKAKDKKRKKEKKDKDLTAHRTVESLYHELAEEGLLKQADPVKLEDYLGSFCYLGTTLQETSIEPMPSAADVRQLIALNAVIPLGCQAVHEKGLAAKTILLIGPTGVGKRMLVHAICQETGANLFDLSPLNLAGKYPGKSGLQMMLHMVFKVAKLMQPSVIWIGGAEKMFYKKVPKEEKEADPKRLKKDLPKLLKSVAEDRVLVLGTARDPACADLKSLLKLYAKVFLLPRPDYTSRHLLWRRFIEAASGEVTKALNVGCLARMSDGYTQGQIAQMVQMVLTEARLQQLPNRPLAATEFVPSLAKVQPVTQQEEELKNWFAKTPQGKARSEAAAAPDLIEASPDNKEKNKKEKKKAK